MNLEAFFFALKPNAAQLRLLVDGRTSSHREMVTLTALTAWDCLPVFEQRFPDDLRPRLALESVARWLENSTEVNRQAAARAARDALDAVDTTGSFTAAAAARAAAAAAQGAARAAEAFAAIQIADRSKKEVRDTRYRRVQAKNRDIDPFTLLGLVPVEEFDPIRPITERQAATLENAGIQTRDLNFSQAEQLIEAIVDRAHTNLCTYKQAQILYRYDLSPNLPKTIACRVISILKSNGWKKPIGFVIPDDTAPTL